MYDHMIIFWSCKCSQYISSNQDTYLRKKNLDDVNCAKEMDEPFVKMVCLGHTCKTTSLIFFSFFDISLMRLVICVLQETRNWKKRKTEKSTRKGY